MLGGFGGAGVKQLLLGVDLGQQLVGADVNLEAFVMRAVREMQIEQAGVRNFGRAERGRGVAIPLMNLAKNLVRSAPAIKLLPDGPPRNPAAITDMKLSSCGFRSTAGGSSCERSRPASLSLASRRRPRLGARRQQQQGGGRVRGPLAAFVRSDSAVLA